MTKFEGLFGIKKSAVANTCVLLPLLAKGMLEGLGLRALSKGKLYSSGQGKDFTAIITGVGAGLTGDAVLYLAETRCRNIILFGSCGLVGKKAGLDIGSLVAPVLSYSFESFSDMLFDKKIERESFPADKGLIENFLEAHGEVKKVNCATLGSLKLEEEMTDLFLGKDIAVVDMEASAVFSAAQSINRRAMAIFYVTDIINQRPFYSDLGSNDKNILSSSIKTSALDLCNFIKNNLSS